MHQVNYLVGDSAKTFWVLGESKQVYAPGYPVSIGRILLIFLFVLLILGAIGAVVYFLII